MAPSSIHICSRLEIINTQKHLVGKRGYACYIGFRLGWDPTEKDHEPLTHHQMLHGLWDTGDLVLFWRTRTWNSFLPSQQDINNASLASCAAQTFKHVTRNRKPWICNWLIYLLRFTRRGREGDEANNNPETTPCDRQLLYVHQRLRPHLSFSTRHTMQHKCPVFFLCWSILIILLSFLCCHWTLKISAFSPRNPLPCVLSNSNCLK